MVAIHNHRWCFWQCSDLQCFVYFDLRLFLWSDLCNRMQWWSWVNILTDKFTAEFYVLQLRSHLTEVLLDQMPVLSELQRYLEQLAIMDPPAVKSELIIEQVGKKIFVFRRSRSSGSTSYSQVLLSQNAQSYNFCTCTKVHSNFAVIEFALLISWVLMKLQEFLMQLFWSYVLVKFKSDHLKPN